MIAHAFGDIVVTTGRRLPGARQVQNVHKVPLYFMIL
jgi:hypothetical protein